VTSNRRLRRQRDRRTPLRRLHGQQRRQRPRPWHRRRQRPPGKRHRGILPGACPRLLAEAELYCYSTDPGRRAEIPEDDNIHALSALRYLIAKLDAQKLGRKPKPLSTPPVPESTEKAKVGKCLSLKNEALWAQVWSIGWRS
jgi:hypothetical protein